MNGKIINLEEGIGSSYVIESPNYGGIPSKEEMAGFFHLIRYISKVVAESACWEYTFLSPCGRLKYYYKELTDDGFLSASVDGKEWIKIAEMSSGYVCNCDLIKEGPWLKNFWDWFSYESNRAVAYNQECEEDNDNDEMKDKMKRIAEDKMKRIAENW